MAGARPRSGTRGLAARRLKTKAPLSSGQATGRNKALLPWGPARSPRGKPDPAPLPVPLCRSPHDDPPSGTCGPAPRRAWRLPAGTGGAAVAAVRDVEIDPEGTFKYILVRLQRPGGQEPRDIVRGTKAAEFHNHIFEKVNPEMEKLGYECKCLGGGKIDHNSKDKKIRVFGLSTGYGKADHSVTVEILKKAYPDYEITWSDDKK